MLANIGGDVGISPSSSPQRFDNFLWFHQAVFIFFVTHTMTRTPLVDLFPPGGYRISIRRFTSFIQQRHHFVQHRTHWPDNGHIGGDGFGNRRWINIDMNDLGVRTKLGRGIGHSVIKASAYRQHHIGVVHHHVRFVGAVHP